MNRTYLVVFEKTATGRGAFAPDVPGTGGLGEALEDTGGNLREGVGSMLKDFAARGLPLPERKSAYVDLSEFDPDPASRRYVVERLTVGFPSFMSASASLEARAV